MAAKEKHHGAVYGCGLCEAFFHALKMATKEKRKALQYSHSLGFGLRQETIPQDNRQKGNPTAVSG